jgi:hypothetical protein
LNVWAVTHGDRARSLCPSVLRALGASGIDAHARGEPAAPGPGIVVFDTASPELCALIAAASRAGAERVLAIGAGGDALADGGSWRVMDAGAGDVIAWENAPGRRGRALHGRARARDR